MTFTESVSTCFRKYIDFSGRASRSEYWWFFLFTVIVRLFTTWIPFIGFLIALALLLPSLSATARRLHDTNRSGWWMLLPIGLGIAGIVAGVSLAFVGLFVLGVGLAILGSIGGFLALLVFLIQPGDPHPNQYGPDPLTAGTTFGGPTQPGHPYDPPPGTGEILPPLVDSGFDSGPEDAPPYAGAGERRYCTQCGMQLEVTARFCNVCGAPVQQS